MKLLCLYNKRPNESKNIQYNQGAYALKKKITKLWLLTGFKYQLHQLKIFIYLGNVINIEHIKYSA